MRKITISLASVLLLLCSFTANAELNMGGKTIFTGTLIKILEPGPATQIQDIIDNIADASAAKPYLIHLGPGVYDLVATSIIMKEWVSIQGSGQESTKITGEVSTTNGDARSAVLVGVNNATLSDMTIENTGGSSYSFAIHNSTRSPRIERVFATASGGSSANMAVSNRNNSNPTMINITASATGGNSNYGVFNYSSSSPVMINITATATGGAYQNFGVLNLNSSPTMLNVYASANGGAESYGIYHSESSLTMTNGSASASGGTVSYGMYITYSSSFTKDSNTEGGTKGLYIDSNSTGSRIVNSKIIGGVTDGSGATNCRGNYDADFADVNC